MEDILVKKRNRQNNEDAMYAKINTPDILESPINYFLSQIIKEYEEGIPYYFLFDGYADDIIVSCIWGNMPVYEGAIANFTIKVNIDDIASYVNYGKLERVFDFFSNIECLINVDSDMYRKLSFFENGKYGFIYKGKKDYYLLMDIKSLDKFEFIDKNNDYCQFWLLKIDDHKILELLKLKSIDKNIAELTVKIDEFKRIIEERNSYFQNERKDYLDRIRKLMKKNDQDLASLEEKYQKELIDKEKIIEQFKNDNKNRIRRVKKFMGLKTYKDCFSIIQESNVISYEELSIKDNQDGEESKNNEQDNICILCFIRPRDIFFEKCGHCCICEECLSNGLHKYNKKKKRDEYFCPLCNSYTKKDDISCYSSVRKIIYA
jgi:hypothetical protein